MTDIDYAAIAKQIVDDHVTFCKGTDKEHKSYEPCYFDRGYSDTNEEVMSAFVSGETRECGFPVWRELAYDVLMDWESDAIWRDATELTSEYMKTAGHDDDFDDDMLKEQIRYALEDANTQDVALEWVRDMRPPHIRVQVDGFADPSHMDIENDTPEKLLEEAGIETTDKNIEAARSIMREAWHSTGYYNLFLVFRMDIPNDMDGDKVRIVGECELWATNVYAGDGMAETVDVDITIDRGLLCTDKDQAGYSYNEVFGPHWPSVGQPDLTFIKTEKEAAA